MDTGGGIISRGQDTPVMLLDRRSTQWRPAQPAVGSCYFSEEKHAATAVTLEPGSRGFWARRVLLRAVQITRRWRVRRTPRASVRPRPSTAVRFFTTISFPQPFPRPLEGDCRRARSAQRRQIRPRRPRARNGLENRFGGFSSDEGSNPSPSVFSADSACLQGK